MKLGRLNPNSVFGFLLCGVGAIWTIVEYFRYISLVNQLRPASNLQWWPMFVPIYGHIYITTSAKELNKCISERGLSVPKANESMLLAFILPIVNFHSMFSTFNKVADAVGQ